jgi:adenylate kinase
LLGPPGSGKGTQSKAICEKYGIIQISTGDILRKAKSEGTELGKKAAEYMDKGELVPDDIIIGVIEERLKESDCENGFLMDGFPRTIAQAESFEEMLERTNRLLTAVINLEVGEELLVERLCKRRVCRECGENFHLVYNPPKEDNLCDNCGGILYQRDDDTEEVVLNRLKVYKQQTAPLVNFYENLNLLIKIDGTGPIPEIQKRIITAIDGKIKSLVGKIE